jgi:CHAT domain-containing protein/tetratricopeptide (TPR) repeat protein
MSFEQRGVYLATRLLDPAGNQLLKVANQVSTRVSFSAVAVAGGSYRLEVTSLEANVRRPYRIWIEELRDKANGDDDRIQADHCFSEAEQLVAQYRSESYRAAVQKYEDAANHWRLADYPAGVARAMRRAAWVLGRVGDLVTADRYINQALAISRTCKDASEVAAALNDLARNYIDEGKTGESIDLSNQAIHISRLARDREAEAQALFNMGYANTMADDKDAALRYYEEALSIFSEIGERRGIAAVLTFIGMAKGEKGDLAGALQDEFDRALPLWAAAQDQWGLAKTRNTIGLLYSMMGEPQKALDLQREARKMFGLIGDQRSEAVCLNSIGYILIGLGQLDEALQSYQSAARMFRTMGDPVRECVAIARIGKIYELRHQNALAIKFYLRWLSLVRELHTPRMEAIVLRWIGNVYMERSPAAALFYYQKASRIGRSVIDPAGEAETLAGMASIYRTMRKDTRSLEYFRRALTLRRNLMDRDEEASTLYCIADIERRMGKLDEARADIQEAIGINERLRAKVVSQELRSSYFASVHHRYELYTDILMAQEKQEPRNGFQAAFEASERGRSRSLLEMLAEARANIRKGIDPSLLQTEAALLKKLGSCEQSRIKLLSGNHTDLAAAALQADWDSIFQDYNEVEDKIRQASPQYAALINPQPLGLGNIQREVLEPGTLLLEYSLGERRSFLWAVTGSTIRGYWLPGRKTIESIALHVYELLAKAHSREQERLYWTEAGRLSRILLGPVSSQLGSSRLLVVSDGALQYIPFPALPAPRDPNAPSGSRPVPMAALHEIIYLPSASMLQELRQEIAQRKPAPRSVAVLANPVYDKYDSRIGAASGQSKHERGDSLAELKSLFRGLATSAQTLSLPPLPATQDEADAIVKLVPDEKDRLVAVGLQATREAAMRPELGQYRIIHFATHGLFDSEHPDRSGLVLSMVDERGQPRNGVLSLTDIYNLNLPADLVVLSACNTALGRDIRGEGLVGLVRGFMYAGAANVVSSLWRVDDTAAAEFMTRFYNRMLQDRLRPAAALRAAQISMWKDPAWSSPRNWAAYTSQGEWR